MFARGRFPGVRAGVATDLWGDHRRDLDRRGNRILGERNRGTLPVGERKKVLRGDVAGSGEEYRGIRGPDRSARDRARMGWRRHRRGFGVRGWGPGPRGAVSSRGGELVRALLGRLGYMPWARKLVPREEGVVGHHPQ